MKEPSQTSDLGQTLETQAKSLRARIDLLDACLTAGRLQWAAEVVKEIQSLAAGVPAAQPTAPAPSKRPWIPASGKQILQVLENLLGSRPQAEAEGPLVICTFNGHLLDPEKAERLMEPLLYLVKRAHAVLFQESNVDALRLIARAAKYGLNASHRNNREQACGILFHPRLHWLGSQPIYHDYLLQVPDHPEMSVTLRPAIQRRVVDRWSGLVLDLINMHGKSNVGGPDETRPIRRYQFEQLVAELARQAEKSPYQPRTSSPPPETGSGTESGTIVAAPDYSKEEALPLGAVVLGGDFNAPLEREETTEIQPLLQAGLKLEKTADGRWSYRYKTEGGQFDGFFTRGFVATTRQLWIPEFPASKRDAAWYRDFSDHLPGFLEIAVAAKQPAESVPPSTPQAADS